MKELCRKCKLELVWLEVSSGGDGYVHCQKCGWVQDLNTNLEEQENVLMMEDD